VTVPAQPEEQIEVRTTEPAPVPAPRRQPARGVRRRRDPVRRGRAPRRLPVALAGTVAFALLAAFFAWQAAEPLWLAFGRGETGIATVTRCQASEHVTYRCVAFRAGSGSFEVADVTLRGAGDVADAEGVRLPARMISASHDRAYAASTTGLHLRWSIALLLVVACGAGIAWVSGAARLDDRRSRRRAVLASFAAPLLLALGFVTAAF
jgi:hypothetical protein